MKLGFGTRTTELLSRGEREKGGGGRGLHFLLRAAPSVPSAPSCLPLRLLPETNESGRKRKEEGGKEGDAEELEGGSSIRVPGCVDAHVRWMEDSPPFPEGGRETRVSEGKGWYEMARSGG